MVGYHGSGYYGEIKRFRKSKQGALGAGLIYFATDKKTAMDYAVKEYGSGKVYTVELTEKLFRIPDNEEPVDFLLTAGMAAKRKAENCNYAYWIKASDLNRYKKKGYEGIAWRNEIAVFSPDSIKIKKIEDVKWEDWVKEVHS